ncbi:MAG: hypothetical protein WCK20_09650, partial [Thermoleophilia bacterium]
TKRVNRWRKSGRIIEFIVVLLRSRTGATSCLERETRDLSFSDGLVSKYPRIRERAHTTHHGQLVLVEAV